MDHDHFCSFVRHSKYDHFPRGCVWDEISCVKKLRGFTFLWWDESGNRRTATTSRGPKIWIWKSGVLLSTNCETVYILVPSQHPILWSWQQSHSGLNYHKTIKEGGLSKSILPIEIPFWSWKTWGSSISFGSSKSIVSIEMTFRLKTWGSSKYFWPSKTWRSSNYFWPSKTWGLSNYFWSSKTWECR